MHGVRIGLVLAACGALGPVAAGQVVLHSTLGIVNGQTYDRMDPDMHAGAGFYGSVMDAESADDFTLASAATLTSVTLDYVTVFGALPANDVIVNVWSDAGGTPGALLFSQTSPVALSAGFTDTVFGLSGLRLSANVNIPLTASTYWITMKPMDLSGGGDAYFSLREAALVNGSPTVGRDIVGSLYGWNTWTTLPYPGLGGTTSMEIVGIIPAPGTLAGVGVLGVAGLRRRR